MLVYEENLQQWFMDTAWEIEQRVFSPYGELSVNRCKALPHGWTPGGAEPSPPDFLRYSMLQNALAEIDVGVRMHAHKGMLFTTHSYPYYVYQHLLQAGFKVLVQMDNKLDRPVGSEPSTLWAPVGEVDDRKLASGRIRLILDE